MKPTGAGDDTATATVPPLRPPSAEGIRQRCRRRARKVKEAAAAVFAPLFATHADRKRCKCGGKRCTCGRSSGGSTSSVYVVKEQQGYSDDGDCCTCSVLDCIGGLMEDCIGELLD